jgi:hypothetical protein
MPAAEDGAYLLGSGVGSGHHWGKPEVIRAIAAVARHWRRLHPEAPRLLVGDIARPDGGPFPPHKTHRDGCSFDIVTRPKNICHVSYPDQQLTVELAELFVHYGATQILYNHPAVIGKVAICQEWPDHDNHFHVVIDPARVPAEGAPLVLAGAGCADGAWIGAAAGGGEIAFRWRLLAAPGEEQQSFRFRLARAGETAPCYDSEEVRSSRCEHAVALAAPDGLRYRWSVEVVTNRGQTASLAWQEIGFDSTAPRIALLAPDDGAELSENPTFRWSYEDERPQARYRVEVDRRPRDRPGPAFVERDSDATECPFGQRLKRRQKLYWRVVVIDAAGNEGASPWRWFKTSGDYRFEMAMARAKADVNLRGGPGTNHGKLGVVPEGAALQVLGEDGEWLRVRVQIGSQLLDGFVHGDYVERE